MHCLHNIVMHFHTGEDSSFTTIAQMSNYHIDLAVKDKGYQTFKSSQKTFASSEQVRVGAQARIKFGMHWNLCLIVPWLLPSIPGRVTRRILPSLQRAPPCSGELWHRLPQYQ